MQNINSSDTVEIKEEFSGEALMEQVRKTLKKIADDVDCKFDEEVKAGLLTEYLHIYPCIYIQGKKVWKTLKIFPRKKTVKKVILKIDFGEREFKCYVFDEKIMEAVKTKFGEIIKQQKEFSGYTITIKKDFPRAS